MPSVTRHPSAGLRRARDRRAGFTLAELLVVVAILGILASVAIPNLVVWSHRSKRAEAYYGLGALYKDQIAFHADHGLFGDTFDEIGFELEGGTQVDARTFVGRHYTFTVNALPLNGRDRANFRGTAAGDIDPRDNILDVLIVENQLTIVGP